MTQGSEPAKGMNGKTPSPLPLPAVPSVAPQATLHATVFSTKSEIEFPANLGTADCGEICTAEDGCQYALKDGTSKNSTITVPHCEWFCSELAEAVYIPSPTHRVIEKLNGSFVFGSRWVGGVASPAGAKNWYDSVRDGTIPLDDLRSQLSHIFAFDQFVSNEDRHGGNFLVHDQHSKYTILSFDYSRAWISRGFPLPPVPLHGFSNTSLWHAKFVADWAQEYIEADEVDATLAKIKKITRARILKIINEHPTDWLLPDQKNAILDWWGSAEMLARIDAIAAGVRDGSCL